MTFTPVQIASSPDRLPGDGLSLTLGCSHKLGGIGIEWRNWRCVTFHQPISRLNIHESTTL